MPAVKWTEKYRPDSLQEVLGNGKAVAELREWAQSWERGSPITGAAILYGPAGTGKTSAALALATGVRLGLYRDECLRRANGGHDPEDRRPGIAEQDLLRPAAVGYIG